MKPEDIAKVCHEVNREFCESIGDHTQVSWDETPYENKVASLSTVKMHITNPGAGPEMSHQHWMADKIRAGWCWGPKKDPNAKTHPCITPFAELPVPEQSKDYIFRAIVHALKE